ncbi:hypothetical protein [Mycoplasma capricolum]|uniref:Uncharacterized protein n=1 Tax=Mycoplasma capricolum subsp. capricolum TaxID=40479 RepID=A0A0C2W671_MYCCA|nr:hypothetical protein [Mycoplasma capricolum]KIM13792.1 hypothetical protein MCGM508_01712 [Mycoplasma capricolum subsp. capricolum]WBX36105.1 hypothetical protein NO343_04065 [Mycoplasma capricolum subsp. capricolum]WBX36617.1 hypothetical protein NO343_02070 [Mycoplasma capricolum subsp. capricolum]
MEKDFLLSKIYNWLFFIFELLTIVFGTISIFKESLVFLILTGVCCFITIIFDYLYDNRKYYEMKRKYT